MSEYILIVKDLMIRIGGREIVKGISLEVPRNTVFAIMGPSGSGKSTLLRAINRLLDLYEDVRIEGKIYVNGIDVYSPTTDPLEVRRMVGMVFQIPNPLPHLSIYENVALGPKMNRIARNKKELDEIVRWALEKAYLWDEVKDRLHAPAAKLSGGQQQRLCIARALAMKPKLLLMDEPTSNLDPVATSKIEELMIELKKDITIVLVTHNPYQAARVSDYVTFIYDGRVIETGRTGEVFTRPRHELTEKYITGRMG
ncbi:phosphate ABC transporter ATP-binding protein, PhoT family [Ignisphaera aggregans DSM 17230]|uniref:Phosphate ABC transporter ATP-binding protein, PhoT family n=1 Tax=Ignisphaera aggregans (strain DSM 17230 / JCM 13409 / AQ1.S1) TaxID=583356 RepID=E0SR51_IGNAA|nr:phosphate ABC transporter ATP-binding protein, PhoT family [Ignisphaera aggregans DSM 17230]